MEPSQSLKCVICMEKNTNIIHFSCNHNLCFSCSPYYFLRHLQKQGLKHYFLQSPDLEYQCMICKLGKAKMPFEKLTNFPLKPTTGESESLKCEFCYFGLNTHQCIECEQFFCEPCLNSHHKPNKKFDSHKVIKINDNKKNPWLLCKCGSGKSMEKFCLVCKSGFCDICLIIHKEHKNIIPLNDVIKQSENINNLEKQKFLTKTLEEFSKFQEILFKQMDDVILKQTKEFDDFLLEMLDFIMKIKEANKQKSIREFKEIKAFLNCFQNSFNFLIEELDKKEAIFPNKLFQLNKFFSLKSQANPIKFDPKFEIKTEKNIPLKIISNSIHEIYDQINKKYFEFSNDTSFSIFPAKIKTKWNFLFEKHDYKSNPEDLFNNKPEIIENNSFCGFHRKSHVSTSFFLNKETFIVWGGRKHDDGYYPLHIYNLTSRKKEIIIKSSNSPITALGIYPKATNKNSEIQYLYNGDDGGFFRVYDISNKNFKEISKIETKTGHGILSMILFEDKFKEINTESSKAYALIAFNNSAFPIRIYTLNGKFLFNIWNKHNEICCSINYFYDDNSSKTCVFLGFSNTYVELYDLKTKNPIKSFMSKSDVNAIDFLHITSDFKESDRFIIFCEDYHVVKICNLMADKVIQKVIFNKGAFIKDICVWNNEYLIIASSEGEEKKEIDENFNTVNILNLQNLSIKKIIRFPNSSPINLLKTIILKEKDLIEKECCLCFQTGGSFPIYLFH